MKRLIALLIAMIAVIAGAGRAEERSVCDCTPVSAKITEEEVSTSEAPTEAAVSHVSPLEKDLATDASPCEIRPETAGCAPWTEPVKKTETEPAKEIPDFLSSAVDPVDEPSAGAESGDSGDGVTAETDIEKNDETAVAEMNETPDITAEPDSAVEPGIDTEPLANGTETEQGDNAPVFIDPCRGGPNPFDDDTPTEIDDHPVDEFIGEGYDRPGEGMHF